MWLKRRESVRRLVISVWPVTMGAIQSLLWPGADDDRWYCGDEYLTEKFFLWIQSNCPVLIIISPRSLFICLCLHLSICLCLSVCFPVLYLPQSPVCPTSRLPQELSSPQITQKAMETTWTASGSSSQTQAPEFTWHLMTLTSRHHMIL